MVSFYGVRLRVEIEFGINMQPLDAMVCLGTVQAITIERVLEGVVRSQWFSEEL